MRVLVTGANGYLGRGVVDKLISCDGIEVVATDFSFESIRNDIKYIKCDLFSISLESAYEYFYSPDVVLHMAWRDGFQHYSNRHIDDLPLHYKFVEAMTKSGVKKFVGIGSMHEIGFYEGSIDENTPCNPVTPYGISKNALRELTRMSCEKNGCLFQWLRGFYIVGNTNNGNSIFSKIVQMSEKGEKTFPFTMGLNQFDFIDYKDFAEYTVKAVCQDEVNGVINICSGRPEKLSERVERFIKENGYQIKLEYGAFPDRPYDSKAVWGNRRKLDIILDGIDN